MNGSHAHTRGESATPRDAGSHAHHTPPRRRPGTPCATRTAPRGHPLRRRAALAAPLAHAPRTRALGPRPRRLGPANIPPATRARGPQTLLSSLRSPRHSKAAGTPRSRGPQAQTSGPGARPPRVTGRAPSHLAAAAAARGAHGSARLHWRRSPRSRRCRRVQRGGIPGRVGAGRGGAGAGPGLPDSRSGHWLAAAAARRPIAARGRGLRCPGAWAGRRAGLGGGFDRRRPPEPCAARCPPAGRAGRRRGPGGRAASAERTGRRESQAASPPVPAAEAGPLPSPRSVFSSSRGTGRTCARRQRSKACRNIKAPCFKEDQESNLTSSRKSQAEICKGKIANYFQCFASKIHTPLTFLVIVASR
ncbi:hypothetical protein VULLAG_LOCUS20955 [Vulpes lagopus]